MGSFFYAVLLQWWLQRTATTAACSWQPWNTRQKAGDRHLKCVSRCWVAITVSGKCLFRSVWRLWVPFLTANLLRNTSFHPCIPVRLQAENAPSFHLTLEPHLTYKGQGFISLIPEMRRLTFSMVAEVNYFNKAYVTNLVLKQSSEGGMTIIPI